jgi:inner membrane transporter RhtA
MRTYYPAALPILVLALAMLSFQVGAALAKSMFPVVGATGTTALRLLFGAAILMVFWRPWRMRLSLREARVIGIYGLAMGCMNLLFYSSLRSIPLGIAVALEFTGPLALAMFASRRPLDFLWILLAVGGLLGLLPMGGAAQRVAPAGILLALGAGVCWAIYILAGRRAGAAHGGATTALGVLIGALAIVPLGLAENGLHLFAPAILPAAFGVAILSSALPYSLEMYAMPRIATRTFGVLMSGDPALAAVSGWIFLSEHLTALQWLAITCVAIASAGSAFTSAGTEAEPPIS